MGLHHQHWLHIPIILFYKFYVNSWKLFITHTTQFFYHTHRQLNKLIIVNVLHWLANFFYDLFFTIALEYTEQICFFYRNRLSIFLYLPMCIFWFFLILHILIFSLCRFQRASGFSCFSFFSSSRLNFSTPLLSLSSIML